MIKISRKAALLTAGLVLSLSLFTGAEQTTAASYQEPPAAVQSENGISPLSDVIGWRYAIFNNKLFKRQYNYSTGKWIGVWVPAG